MAKFNIQDKDDSQPIIETHYFKWLVDKGLESVHFVKTKVEYLEEQGFQVGVDRLETEDIQRLGFIEKHFATLIN